MTGLSGNEIYCLAQKGYNPGNIVVGNSVHSLGLIRGITSGLKTLSGGEIGSITQLIVDGQRRCNNSWPQHMAGGAFDAGKLLATESKRLLVLISV